MKILYLDTTSNYLYTAVADDEALLCEKKVCLGKELSTKALSIIAQMLSDLKLKPNDIDKIILVNGPGSFTGCRIGITIAKTYAWTLNIPITTISSLEAMALVDDDYDYHVPVIDARRDYVFSGIYDQNNNQIMKNQYIKKDVLQAAIDNMTDNYVYITNDDINLVGNVKKYDPDLLAIINKYRNREEINPHGIDADYLKLTEAEEKLNDR